MNRIVYYLWTLRALFLLRYIKRNKYGEFLKKCEESIEKLMRYSESKRDEKWHDVLSWFLMRKADALNYFDRIDEALEAVQESLKHAKLLKDDVSYLRALLVYGVTLSGKDRNRGVEVINEVLEPTRECTSKSKKQIRAWALLQKARSVSAEYEPILEEAIRLLTELKAHGGLGQAYYLLYEKTKEEKHLEKAKEYFRKAKIDPEKAIERLEKGGS
jgi:tetratricopeptide (TPR) repeat protein